MNDLHWKILFKGMIWGYPILGNLHVSKDGVYHQLWHVMAILIEDTT